MIDPTVFGPGEHHRAVLLWRWAEPTTVLSSAAVGGGTTTHAWLANIGVHSNYGRTDLVEHAAEVAELLGLDGSGVSLFTAADVTLVQRGICEGVVVDATVGVTKPTWAADPSGGWTSWEPGTINIVIQVPVALDDGAAVNAIMTATEAKSQALGECGVPGTGTASDAIALGRPSNGSPQRFAGPRSVWGSRIARATHAAVRAGLEVAG